MDEKNLSFEAAFNELKEVAEKLDDNSLSLDESLKLFEKGIELSRYCNEVLTKAKEKLDSIKSLEVDK